MIRRLNEHLAQDGYVGRPREVVTRFFEGLDLVGPGVVKVTQWHPQSDMAAGARTCLWGGVARKPGTYPTNPTQARSPRQRMAKTAS